MNHIINNYNVIYFNVFLAGHLSFAIIYNTNAFLNIKNKI